MKLFNKITIIGVGLIGGSIGLAVKKRHLAGEVIGVFRRRSTLKRALKCKAIDRATMNIREGVKNADLIILATPVYTIPLVAKKVMKFAKRGAIITDVGSTKFWIVRKMERMLKGKRSIFFVGSHPMAGSEQAGVEFAKDDLLDGSPAIVTKTVTTSPTALKKVVSFWEALGANVDVLSPIAHDRSVALISHLPHVVSFSLAGAVPVKEFVLAAEGFKDTTRVASSDPRLWADIFLTNKKEVAKACRAFEKYYKKLVSSLAKGDYAATVKLLKTAKEKRDKLFYGKS